MTDAKKKARYDELKGKKERGEVLSDEERKEITQYEESQSEGTA